MTRTLRAALCAALLLAGCSSPRESRILLLGFDGLDPVAVDTLMAEGRLPHFARLRREGAYGRLQSFEPMLSPILWTTIATGKTPDQHGIGHFVAVDPRSGESLPVTSDLRRVKALWNLFSERDREVAVVGWWATWPPEEVRGAVVSDHLAYHFLFGGAFSAADPTAKTWPPELEGRIRPLVVRPQEIGVADLAPFAQVSEVDLARPFDLQDDLSHLRWLLATTRTYRDVGLELWREERPDLEMVYFEGTDSVAHLFGHLYRAEGLAGELATQQARFGRAVEAIYELADSVLGTFMDQLDRSTILIVLSDHGFQLGALPDDPSRLRDMRRVSERYHREQGVLYLFGHGVRPGARIEGASLLDIAPTVLAAAGLPPAADMPGRVLAGAFVREPEIERIATWERPPGPTRGAAPRDAVADRLVRERLESLGYLGAGDAPGAPAPGALPSKESQSNLAAIAFMRQDYGEAERIYRDLIGEHPDDAGYRTSLAGVLGARGEHAEAMAELDSAIALDPLNPEAYQNRGALLERLGRPGEAVEQYRTALRYRPDYEPSRRALLRLTGAFA
ncbi:MAG: alkaline phosphatase family protein, partial [Thermoanaerobaculia bacterium]